MVCLYPKEVPEDPKDPWLETLLQLLRCHSCSRKPGGAFSDAHVTVVEFLLFLDFGYMSNFTVWAGECPYTGDQKATAYWTHLISSGLGSCNLL